MHRMHSKPLSQISSSASRGGVRGEELNDAFFGHDDYNDEPGQGRKYPDEARSDHRLDPGSPECGQGPESHGEVHEAGHDEFRSSR